MWVQNVLTKCRYKNVGIKMQVQNVGIKCRYKNVG